LESVGVELDKSGELLLFRRHNAATFPASSFDQLWPCLSWNLTVRISPNFKWGFYTMRTIMY
jgi:hypothetical protein